MRIAVGILLAAQVGMVITALTVPSPAGLALLLALSFLGTSTCLWKISFLKKNFQAALQNRVELRTKELEERMTAFEQVAMTDALTGLLNRRGGEAAITPHIARSRRIGTAISFVLIDIDHFKKINDQHGHALGDQVLVAVANTLKQNLRTSDLAIRWGGEEILLCLPDTDLSGAILVSEKLRMAIALVDLEALQLVVTASFGCAELGEDDLSVALARADMQMYLAKVKGRNQVCPQFDQKTG